MKSTTPDEEVVRLPSGGRLRIRALRRGEFSPVRELFARLSPRTRYMRFFSPLPSLPDSLLRLLAASDDPRRVALIAELDEADGGDVVALGNIGEDGSGRAEVGLVVADAWQRQGIGGKLAARLLDEAELRGFHRFVLHGRWDNPALRPLVNHLTHAVSTRQDAGVSEYTFCRPELVPA